MAVPQNKEALIKDIQDTHKKLLADLENIPEALTRDKVIEGNIKDVPVSICDTLAYLIGWGKLVLKWYQRTSNDEAVDFPETGYKWNQLGQLAHKFHTDYADWSFSRLRNTYIAVEEELLTLVNSLSNARLYEQPWYDKWPLGRMIQFNTSSPNKNMNRKIRAWKRQQQL